MRICSVSPFPPTVAGIADYGAEVSCLLAQDARVESLTVLANQMPGAPRRERIGPVDVQRIWKRDSITIGPALLGRLEALRPDVVWFNLGLTIFGTRLGPAASGLAAPLYAKLRGYRTVVTLHELPALANLSPLGFHNGTGRVGASLVPRLLMWSDAVVVTLDRYRHFLRERYGARNVRRIPIGALGEFQCLDEPDRETVLVFGAFGPHKDPGLVVKAVAHLRRRRPTLRLVVAGVDHLRYPGFMAECQAHNELDGSWIGYVPPENLGTMFAGATVVVVPSLAATGSSSVIHRAMTNGRSVLASDLPDFRGMAQDEDLELAWFKAGDSADLAQTLERLLADRSGRRRIVEHNLQAMRRLGPKQIVNSYLAAFGHDSA